MTQEISIEEIIGLDSERTQGIGVLKRMIIILAYEAQTETQSLQPVREQSFRLVSALNENMDSVQQTNDAALKRLAKLDKVNKELVTGDVNKIAHVARSLHATQNQPTRWQHLPKPPAGDKK